VSTPHVIEITESRYREMRAEIADEPPRRPRMAPYDRAAERAMIRASLLATDMHTHAYDRESR
jgi:hypothetical protein